MIAIADTDCCVPTSTSTYEVFASARDCLCVSVCAAMSLGNMAVMGGMHGMAGQ